MRSKKSLIVAIVLVGICIGVLLGIPLLANTSKLPEFIQDVSSQRNFVALPLDVCEDGEALIERFREANRDWLDRAHAGGGSSLRYETTRIIPETATHPRVPTSTPEWKSLNMPYDRGVAWWPVSEVLLYGFDGELEVYEGVEPDTYVVYAPSCPDNYAPFAGFAKCRLPLAYLSSENADEISDLIEEAVQSAKGWEPPLVAEAVFSRSNGRLLRERIVRDYEYMSTIGGRIRKKSDPMVSGAEATFFYDRASKGDYPTEVVVRRFHDDRFEGREGYSEWKMSFTEVDGLMVMREMRLVIHNPEDIARTEWIVENQSMEIVAQNEAGLRHTCE